MKNNGAGDKHINNNLKIVISFGNFLNPNLEFRDVTRKEVISFLDSKINPIELDPDKKWITTWNVYMNHLKYFFRWFYNEFTKQRESESESDYASPMDWTTPEFMKIKKKKTKRLSPYIDSELWSREELLLIIKYEQFKLNPKFDWFLSEEFKKLRNNFGNEYHKDLIDEKINKFVEERKENGEEE